jgi:hypothetical protein
MFVYSIQYVQRPSMGSIAEVLIEAESKLNAAARDGWELDKLMPVESSGYTTGAILVLRRTELSTP